MKCAEMISYPVTLVWVGRVVKEVLPLVCSECISLDLPWPGYSNDMFSRITCNDKHLPFSLLSLVLCSLLRFFLLFDGRPCISITVNSIDGNVREISKFYLPCTRLITSSVQKTAKYNDLNIAVSLIISNRK
jgi:hypothetical protein